MSIYVDKWILLECCALALAFGAAMGSFLNCAAFRIARHESFVSGRSRCPACGHELSARDLVPVLSWLALRGRCRYCGARVSARYPLAELAFAAVTLGCLLRFDLTWLLLRNWIFLACLFCLSLVDLDCFEIPDGCLLISAAAWAATAPALGFTWREAETHLLSALVYGGGILLISLALDRVLGRESLGGGDVKLIAVVGLYLGFIQGLFAIIFACLLGLAMLAFRRRRGGGETLPFGPAIAASAGAMLFAGEALTGWYLGLFYL